MKRKTGVILIFLILFLRFVSVANDMTRRNLGFNFYWDGNIVEMVGNFRGGSEMVRLPMMRVADRHWTLTIRLRPGFYHFRYLLGREHWRQCPFIEDRILIEDGPIQGNFTLLKVFPVDYEHFFVLADEFADQGKLEWKRDVLMEAVKMFPDEEDAYIKLGEVYEKLGQSGLALDSYTAAVERFPEFPEARYRLAMINEQLFSATGNIQYRSNARQQWMWLLEKGHYRRQAREHLN